MRPRLGQLAGAVPAAAVVAGAVITTYAVTRPAPQRPSLDGGGLGWAVRVP